MRTARFRRGARLAAWLLLFWVGVDLSNSSICALDQEGSSAQATSTSEESTSAPVPSHATPAHFDDCFCCSHCVDVSRLHGLVELASVNGYLPLPLQTPAAASTRNTDHPPRA